uniref:Uncharacterized protein n=1 Tax=Arundo donax TaxID=35708 RepID=A0A0A9GBB9_ARUDO
MNHSVFLFRSAGGNACTYSFAIAGVPEQSPIASPPPPASTPADGRTEHARSSELCRCVRGPLLRLALRWGNL